MAWLHTWTGLLLGWLLFAIFTTGTAAFFQDEITQWMQPEVAGPADPANAAAGAVAHLQNAAPGADAWFITLPSDRRAAATVFARPAGEGPPIRATLSEDGEQVTLRETRGGDFLYRFHFDLHYMPWYVARYIVGVAAMLMLIALLSGIVTHKKIVADFFMLRLGKGQRSWLDVHNMSGVFALPFFLMMTYTGMVTLSTMYMPWGVAANYSNPDDFAAQKFPAVEGGERSGVTTSLAPIKPMIVAAGRRWGGADVGAIQILNPGDATAKVVLTRSTADAVGARAPTLVFSGATGAVISASPKDGAASATESVMIGLHAGRFAAPGLRWLYVLSGAAGTVMVGSGLVLWTVKRRSRQGDPQRPHFGFWLVERLNICVIAGLYAGLAIYFIANRLLPVGLANRADVEINALFAGWGAMLVWSVCRPARRAWVEGLSVTAALFAAVPAVNALTTSRGLIASLASSDRLFAGFDVVMLTLALGFALAARRIAVREPGGVQARRRLVEGAAAE